MTPTTTLQFTTDAEHSGIRLDKLLTDRLASEGISRVRVQSLIKEGMVTINGRVAKSSFRFEGGEQVEVQVVTEILSPDNSYSTEPENIPLNVVYEDAYIAAIDKPAGLVVHPAAGHSSGTLVNALLSLYPQVAHVGGEGRAGIVHRLDKDTSGILLIALTEAARLNLMTQFESRQVQKRYLALVDGIPKTISGEIVAPIGRDPDQRKEMAVIRGGREAVSNYNVLESFDTASGEHSLLEVFPKTGRTHQIRVHLAFIGCPIVGDTIYGRRKKTLPVSRHFLHAESIRFTHPVSGDSLSLNAPLPADLQRIVTMLQSESGSA